MTKRAKAFLAAILMALGVIATTVQPVPAGAVLLNGTVATRPWIAGMQIAASGDMYPGGSLSTCTLGVPLYFQFSGRRYWYRGSSGTCEYTYVPSLQGGFRYIGDLNHGAGQPVGTNYTGAAIGGWTSPDYTLHPVSDMPVGSTENPIPPTMQLADFCGNTLPAGSGQECDPATFGADKTPALTLSQVTRTITGGANLTAGDTLCWSSGRFYQDNVAVDHGNTFCSSSWNLNNGGKRTINANMLGIVYAERNMAGAPLFKRGSNGTAQLVGQIGSCYFWSTPVNCSTWEFNLITDITNHLATGWQY